METPPNPVRGVTVGEFRRQLNSYPGGLPVVLVLDDVVAEAEPLIDEPLIRIMLSLDVLNVAALAIPIPVSLADGSRLWEAHRDTRGRAFLVPVREQP
jgi:hypothetical protein